MSNDQQRPLSSGELIDTFQIEQVLGAGGFGITYLALDTSFDRQVAIKEYFPQNAWRNAQSRAVSAYEGEAAKSFEVGLKRFHREGKILAQFNHPNIIRVQRIISANGTAYLVMDYEDGETLEAYLHRLKRPLTYDEAKIIISPLLDGLSVIHDRNLLHLDIKTDNIFIRSDSTPVLIDFGGARHHLGQTSQVVSFLVASDGYSPPEQYSGSNLQPSTDIYALGATLYRSITNEMPSDAQKRGLALIDSSPDPMPLVQQMVDNGQYPDHFLQAIDSALNMKVNSRPQLIREFQQRLFSISNPETSLPSVSAQVQSSTSVPQPVSNPQEPKRSNNFNPVYVGASIVIFLLGGMLLWKFNTPATSSGHEVTNTEQTIQNLQQQNNNRATKKHLQELEVEKEALAKARRLRIAEEKAADDAHRQRLLDDSVAEQKRKKEAIEARRQRDLDDRIAEEKRKKEAAEKARRKRQVEKERATVRKQKRSTQSSVAADTAENKTPVRANEKSKSNTIVGRYKARLSRKDHFSSRKKKLGTPAMIIRQDRANYHKFKKRDPEDQNDNYFDTTANRSKLQALLNKSTSNIIMKGEPLISVVIYKKPNGRHDVKVTILEE